eukprot:2372451-Pleurochrysis_carterae.AAC.2
MQLYQDSATQALVNRCKNAPPSVRLVLPGRGARSRACNACECERTCKCERASAGTLLCSPARVRVHGRSCWP